MCKCNLPTRSGYVNILSEGKHYFVYFQVGNKFCYSVGYMKFFEVKKVTFL